MSWEMSSWQGTKPSSWKRWASRSRSWLCHTLPMIWSVPSSPRRFCWDQLGSAWETAGKCWVDLLIWRSLALICCTWRGRAASLHSDCTWAQADRYLRLQFREIRNDSDSMVQKMPNLDLTTESCFHTVSISQSISTLKSSDSSDSSYIISHHEIYQKFPQPSLSRASAPRLRSFGTWPPKVGLHGPGAGNLHATGTGPCRRWTRDMWGPGAGQVALNDKWDLKWDLESLWITMNHYESLESRWIDII